LGQGAPGTEPPTELIDATTEAMRAGFNQYAPGQGFPQLLEAVAAQRERDFGQRVDPAEVLYTAGATEGLRSEEHTSELQSRFDLVCRLLLEKKKKRQEEDKVSTTVRAR